MTTGLGTPVVVPPGNQVSVICDGYNFLNANTVQAGGTIITLLDGTETIEKKYVQGSLPARYRNVKRWILPEQYTHGKVKLNDILYSATHVNHPSAVWCRQSLLNYKWLHALLVELCQEYTYRYGKVHKCQETGLVEFLATPPANIPEKPFTEPTPAMPEHCKVKGDSVSSYRTYYVMEKGRMLSWKGKINNRQTPNWLMDKLYYINGL